MFLPFWLIDLTFDSIMDGNSKRSLFPLIFQVAVKAVIPVMVRVVIPVVVRVVIPVVVKVVVVER